MHSDYLNYLYGTTVYKNLLKAKRVLKNLKDSVDELVKELDKSGGETIVKMKTDVTNAKKFITDTINAIDALKSKLEYNAKRFDATLDRLEKQESWKVEYGVTTGSYLLNGTRTEKGINKCQIISVARDPSDGNIMATIKVDKYIGVMYKGSFYDYLKYDVNGVPIG